MVRVLLRPFCMKLCRMALLLGWATGCGGIERDSQPNVPSDAGLAGAGTGGRGTGAEVATGVGGATVGGDGGAAGSGNGGKTGNGGSAGSGGTAGMPVDGCTTT